MQEAKHPKQKKANIQSFLSFKISNARSKALKAKKQTFKAFYALRFQMLEAKHPKQKSKHLKLSKL